MKLGRMRRAGAVLFVVAAAAFVSTAPSVSAQTPPPAVELAVSLPLTGEGALSFGRGTLEGIRLAVEEANAGNSVPHIELAIYDDQSGKDAVTEVAEKIVASRAAVVVGPSYSTTALAQGPIYAKAGLASLCPTATSDAVTDNATTFRMIFKNSQQAEALAVYLAKVLGRHSANVIVVDDKYGQTLRSGFETAAQRLGIEAHWFAFKTPEEAQAIAERLGADGSGEAIVFLTLDGDAVRLLTALRRKGVGGPFIGGDALGDEAFSGLFANLPEERRQPGFFTDGLFAVSPLILDSANAQTLAFADRFRARFGHDPVWMAVAGYDAGRMAIAAVRAATGTLGANADAKAVRTSALNWLASVHSVELALPGLLGPLWFDAEHGGHGSIRIGRFNRTRFESAPLQIVPVPTPDPTDIAAGSVFEGRAGNWARLQRVVYSGMFLNEIARIDIAQSTFTADLYLWMRFAKDGGATPADPTDIEFPTLVRGSFDPNKPVTKGELGDGTVYRLWKVRGDFKNDFDLRRYPADRQNLVIQFFNAGAASDRIIYVLDRRSAGGGTVPGGGMLPSSAPVLAAQALPLAERPSVGSAVSAEAFRNLSQWLPLRVRQHRDNLVTPSALGNPRLVGVERIRELSGFGMTVELRRRVISTLAKTLLPLALMSLIMFASLYFPNALVKEKITVAITGALSGAVLLSSINSQLGNVGYVIAVEYGFYAFFILCLLCIVSVLAAERCRTTGRQTTALTVEKSGRYLFVLGFAATAAAAWLAISQW
jgi:branched-chain amino acid transport system substrate-binding protein